MEEWREVLDLRRRCFSSLSSIQSEHDTVADHLVVRDSSEGKLCGAYRILSTERFLKFDLPAASANSTVSGLGLSFESGRDFDLAPILAKEGVKLELAWACIDPAYRDGRVVGLLWQGISDYIRQSGAKVIFGVTSVFEKDHAILPEIQKFLSENQTIRMRQDSPVHRLEFAEPKAVVRPPLRRRVLPALLRAYLMAGAIIWAQPFFDEENNCYDFMTVLEIESAAPSILQHFHL